MSKPVKCDFSNPRLYNPAYIPLFDNHSEFLHLYGSAGSGKSRFEAQREIVLSFDSRRRDRKTLVVRKVATTLKDSVFAELKSVIYGWGLPGFFHITESPPRITNRVTNIAFVFIGLDNAEKVKSISGVDRVWIEEATELTDRRELDQLRLRLRGFDRVQVTLSYNPININHWLNKEIHEAGGGGHFLFKSTYKDNVRMLEADPNYAKYIEGLKTTNPAYYRVYGLGLWGVDLEGLIYPEYKTVDEMPEPQFYGLDFGYNDPCALIAGAVVDNFNAEKKDYFVEEVVYARRLTSGALIKLMDDKGVSKSAKIIADNARPEMIEDIKNAGYNIDGCTKYKGSVLDGINAVKDTSLCIVTGSRELLREIQNYTWKEKGGKYMDDEPQDTLNHAMDALRYGLEAVRAPGAGATTFRFKVI